MCYPLVSNNKMERSIESSNTPLTISNSRLKFIDAGRSIAILLMLVNHFITLTIDKSSFDNNSSLYLIWVFVKGFTGPMFFSITGIIFVYLLCRNNHENFFKINRVKKGFRRSIELLFWGYLLQLNIQDFNQYITLEFNSWVFAFHVLQCIGIGIILILLIFGIFKLINVGKLHTYYLITGTIMFLLYPSLKELPQETFFPNNTFEMFQNMLKGVYSVFPIVPWVAFVLYGAAVGALIHHYKDYITSKRGYIIFILCGLALNFLPWLILTALDSIFDTNFVISSGLIARFGQVVVVVGILILLDKYFKSNSLFLRIGANTLPIYIIHVMILYSGFWGIGINQILKNALTPLESIFGASFFSAFFIILVNYYHYFEVTWSKFKTKIRRIMFLSL